MCLCKLHKNKKCRTESLHKAKKELGGLQVWFVGIVLYNCFYKYYVIHFKNNFEFFCYSSTWPSDLIKSTGSISFHPPLFVPMWLASSSLGSASHSYHASLYISTISKFLCNILDQLKHARLLFFYYTCSSFFRWSLK